MRESDKKTIGDRKSMHHDKNVLRTTFFDCTFLLVHPVVAGAILQKDYSNKTIARRKKIANKSKKVKIKHYQTNNN